MTANTTHEEDNAFYQAFRAEIMRIGWPIVRNYFRPLGYRKFDDVPVQHRQKFLDILRDLPSKKDRG